MALLDLFFLMPLNLSSKASLEQFYLSVLGFFCCSQIPYLLFVLLVVDKKGA